MPAIKEESENLFFEQFTSAATSSSQVQEAAQTQPKTMDHKHHEIKSEIGENYYEEPETDEPQIMTKKDTFTVEKKPKRARAMSAKKRLSLRGLTAVRVKIDKRIVQTMTAQQKAVYDKATEKCTILQQSLEEERRNLEEEKAYSSSLNERIKSLESFKVEPVETEANIELRKEIAKLLAKNEKQEKKLDKQANKIPSFQQRFFKLKSDFLTCQKDLRQTSQLLANSTRSEEILRIGQNKLREAFVNNAAANRKLEARNAELEKENDELKEELGRIQVTLNAIMSDDIKNELTRSKKKKL